MSFVDTNSISLSQTKSYAQAYLSGTEPDLDFSVDVILEDERNRWLDNLHITTNMNFEQFAPSLRKSRDNTHAAMEKLIEHWRKKRPSFDDILNRELNSFAEARVDAMVYAVKRLENAYHDNDTGGLLESTFEPIFSEFLMLRELFLKENVNETDLVSEIYKFWLWERNRDQPCHKISAYLIAAIGRKICNGQKQLSQGMWNDIKAFSTYSPYVDAIFVDRECASLFSKEPLISYLIYKSRVFYYGKSKSFLEYLDDLEAVWKIGLGIPMGLDL